MIETERLILRHWRDDDLGPCAEMNADPQVMRHFPQVLTYRETAGMVARVKEHIEVNGFGFWAVEVKGGPRFAGFIGFGRTPFEAAFTPCVEIGWRLLRPYWGQGFASEGASAALDFGFERLALPEILAFTVPRNTRSRAVMRKLGMVHDAAGDFDHPWIPEGHALRRHLLYRMTREAWRAQTADAIMAPESN